MEEFHTLDVTRQSLWEISRVLTAPVTEEATRSQCGLILLELAQVGKSGIRTNGERYESRDTAVAAAGIIQNDLKEGRYTIENVARI